MSNQASDPERPEPELSKPERRAERKRLRAVRATRRRQTATRAKDRKNRAKGKDDTMGFTVVGPDRFLASGHPDMREMQLRVVGKPPLLGLIESLDAGRTWRSRSLLGDADLHTIVATSGLLVAYDSSGERVLSSSDGGTSWETRSQVPLVDLAVDPGETSRMAAIDRSG